VWVGVGWGEGGIYPFAADRLHVALLSGVLAGGASHSSRHVEWWWRLLRERPSAPAAAAAKHGGLRRLTDNFNQSSTQEQDRLST
jgi:hypothetical protein